MIPWETIDQARVPGLGETVTLRKRGEEYSIRTRETELMNSRVHGSEDELARETLSRLSPKDSIRILIGGLGMGFTLAAALENAGPNSRITVAELIPAVVDWNKHHLGHLAGTPLTDSRVQVKTEDVMALIQQKASAWDAILLDVDNGPKGLTRAENNRLYTRSGIENSRRALTPGGIFSVWSAADDPAFTRLLNQCRFKTDIVRVRARKPGKGARHTIWLAQKRHR